MLCDAIGIDVICKNPAIVLKRWLVFVGLFMAKRVLCSFRHNFVCANYKGFHAT